MASTIHPAAAASARRAPSARAPAAEWIAALRAPECYPHPADALEVIETHISIVVLAGDHAYKIKKPVRLPFLDFSTLEARRRFCLEEVRLNRRTAPDLYLGVVAIGGTARAPRIGGPGPVIEYAVHMRRFPREATFDHLADGRGLEPPMVDALARAVADLHEEAALAGADEPYGTPERVLSDALANFHAIEALEKDAPLLEALERLRGWTLQAHRKLAPLLAERRSDGLVRECHGDLHLGNVAWLGGRAVPFDAIEFDPGLRWIDVMSEVAYTWMDLERHGLHALAARFLEGYLERTGDYPGLRTLRFYAVYRALVRAKVACIRAHQLGGHDPQRAVARADMSAHLGLAQRLCRPPHPAVVLMHGLSGSGKSVVSQRLLEALGAIRLRSDVERKRRFGLPAHARHASAPGTGLYTPREDDLTYGHLAELASWILASGYPVIVDASFLRRSRRDAFRALASATGASFTIVACEAPPAVLRARLAAREAGAADASDAGPAVLEHQMRGAEPLARDEIDHVVRVDTTGSADLTAACAKLARRLHPDRR